MFKILLVSIITFIIVIITFLIFMSFMNVDIKTNSRQIEKFVDQEPKITGGGSYNKDIGYCIFIDNGTITFNSETICEVLIVGGGGGGARNDDWEGGGGGGGGGVGYGAIQFQNGTYNINIGKGGNGGGINGRVDNGINGGNTTIIGNLINETAYGGGGGGWRPGLNGGSGGGGSGHAGNFEGGIPNKGNSLSTFNKANIYYYGNSGGFGFNASGGGGGGGADTKGLATGNGNYSAGNGGNGKNFNITGSNLYYGGGGGGASGCYGGCDKANGTIAGNGGLGGGGNGGNRNNPTDGENNTGGGGGGASKRNGAKGGSGVVIIRYKNISNINYNSTDDIVNLFSIKKPWGMYFAEDFDNIYLKDRYTLNDSQHRHAAISGNIKKSKGLGYGATASISYIAGGTGSSIIWPRGSIPSNFTILSLTRYTGKTNATRARILSSDRNGGNFLHGHWGKNYWDGYRGRGSVHYDGWKSYWAAPNIGNQEDWLCAIGKNQDIRPDNILFDGVPSGTHGSGGLGNFTLSINSNPWNENSDWALSCVIIWDQHLSNNEMQLLNRLINNYKATGEKIINIINNNTKSVLDTGDSDQKEPLLKDDEQFNSNNEAYNYVIQYDNEITHNVNVINVDINKDEKRITINFKDPFILKKILFVAKEQRKSAPAQWTINGLGGLASSQDYDAIQGKPVDHCVKFYINNEISSKTYSIKFTHTIGGIIDGSNPLGFYRMILYEGKSSPVMSTAGESIAPPQ
jgi:hypothetical protein